MSFGKMVAFTGLLLLSTLPLQSQWAVGGLIGFNVASISVPTGTSSEDYSSRVGFGIGAVVDRPLTEHLIIHLEPMFLQKGAAVENSCEFSHENLTFFAETRCVVGMANINKESDESAVKNRGLQVLVGVTLPVGPK
jgi:hypothetical protein